MSDKRWQGAVLVPATLLGFLVLVGCAGGPTLDTVPAPASPAPAPLPLPPAFQPQELVGRWGYASFHRAEDQKRTEAAARRSCNKPYVIGRGPGGGVMMHLPDETDKTELNLKGGPGGKTYVGPDAEPGGELDREVVSFDGRVLVLKWVDQEVGQRYGTGIYVRCAPRA
jgi:hypothetical protein